MTQFITYEQPLNERIRTFLRVESLFSQFEYFSQSEDQWGIRSAINCLLDINDLVSRTDLKTELIKELDRHSVTLKALKQNPDVDPDRLDMVLDDISRYIENLRDNNFQPGLTLKQDELINSIKQRNTILGGSCNFDLPAYHQWLHSPIEVQKDTLRYWQKDLVTLKNSILLSMHLIRSSTNPTRETAIKGFYQKAIEPNVSCQLIRIVMPVASECYPEISAGKHRFTIRFMAQKSTSGRPSQTDDDINFELHCCIL